VAPPGEWRRWTTARVIAHCSALNLINVQCWLNCTKSKLIQNNISLSRIISRVFTIQTTVLRQLCSCANLNNKIKQYEETFVGLLLECTSVFIVLKAKTIDNVDTLTNDSMEADARCAASVRREQVESSRHQTRPEISILIHFRVKCEDKQRNGGDLYSLND